MRWTARPRLFGFDDINKVCPVRQRRGIRTAVLRDMALHRRRPLREEQRTPKRRNRVLEQELRKALVKRIRERQSSVEIDHKRNAALDVQRDGHSPVKSPR